MRSNGLGRGWNTGTRFSPLPNPPHQGEGTGEDRLPLGSSLACGRKLKFNPNNPNYKNRFSTSSGAAAYVLGVIEQLARPWLKLRIALE